MIDRSTLALAWVAVLTAALFIVAAVGGATELVGSTEAIAVTAIVLVFILGILRKARGVRSTPYW